MPLADSWLPVAYHRGMTAFVDPIAKHLGRWGIPVSASQLERMEAHFAAMVEANRVMNLTRITDPTEAAVKHYADALFALVWIQDQQVPVETVLDIGTGAGFPAVPLAIMRPQWSVTALDATGKKIDFVARTAATLGLDNLHAEHGHGDHWKPGRTFDLVVARALGPLERCLRAGAKFVAPTGRLAIYKTRAQADAEHAAARDTVRQLRLKHDGAFCYQLFLGEQTLERALLVYHREQHRGRRGGSAGRS